MRTGAILVESEDVHGGACKCIYVCTAAERGTTRISGYFMDGGRMPLPSWFEAWQELTRKRGFCQPKHTQYTRIQTKARFKN